jgi:uncharacterized membrane protein
MTENDRQLDTTIAEILRLGVTAAAILTVIGFVLYLLRSGGLPVDYAVFHRARFPKGWLEAGILLLILTPVARVIFSVYAFARAKDFTYVAICLIVLGLLCVGWLTGHSA